MTCLIQSTTDSLQKVIAIFVRNKNLKIVLCRRQHCLEQIRLVLIYIIEIYIDLLVKILTCNASKDFRYSNRCSFNNGIVFVAIKPTIAHAIYKNNPIAVWIEHEFLCPSFYIFFDQFELFDRVWTCPAHQFFVVATSHLITLISLLKSLSVTHIKTVFQPIPVGTRQFNCRSNLTIIVFSSSKFRFSE